VVGDVPVAAVVVAVVGAIWNDEVNLESCGRWVVQQLVTVKLLVLIVLLLFSDLRSNEAESPGPTSSMGATCWGFWSGC